MKVPIGAVLEDHVSLLGITVELIGHLINPVRFHHSLDMMNLSGKQIFHQQIVCEALVLVHLSCLGHDFSNLRLSVLPGCPCPTENFILATALVVGG